MNVLATKNTEDPTAINDDCDVTVKINGAEIPKSRVGGRWSGTSNA